jgi:hypothetical protein
MHLIRKKNLIILAVTLLLVVSAPLVAAEEIPNGYNGYRWGTPLAKIDSVTLGTFMHADSSAGIHMTAYKSHYISFDNCSDVSCLVSFTEGYLTSVAITGEGYEMFKCLSASMRASYGTPKKIPTKLESSKDGEVKMFDTYATHVVLSYDTKTNSVFLSLEEGLTPHMERMSRILEKSGGSR